MLNINMYELDDVMNKLACKIHSGSIVAEFEAYAKLLECKLKALTEKEIY